MKLTKFIIRNFRSIDEIECYVSNKITILAGKNESGKTNILDALELFNMGNSFSESDKPLSDRSKNPEIELYFSIDKDDITEIKFSYLNLVEKDLIGEFNFMENCPKEIVMKKEFGNSEFLEISKFRDHNENHFNIIIDKIVNSYNNQLLRIKKKKTELTSLAPFEEIIEGIRLYTINMVNNKITQINQAKSQFPDISFDSLLDILKDFTVLIDAKSNFMNEFYNAIPKFVIFKAFEEQLPYSIPINEITNEQILKQKYRIVYDLLRIAKFPIEILKSNDHQERSSEIRKASREYTDDFGEYSHQEIREKFEEFKKKGYSIYIYKDWKKAYDFLKLLVKFSIIKYQKDSFSLDENGFKLKNQLRYSEEEFKNLLFEIAYLSSLNNAIRFREFCDYLKFSLSDSDRMSIERFELAKENILKSSQMTNRNAIDFLFSIDVICELGDEIQINTKRFANIDTEEIALGLLMSYLNDNRTITIDNATRILRINNINPNVIYKLQAKEKLIIRSVRSGRYIDFS